ncbi:hypothetical protein [Feifania hominis]|uniref:Uncharacterized protein n=1 Tax=Feifania hominis TaxID=2763660 RepID=A0A926HVR8_9FIRM|nr:hypothetical protein [Feifania hominis]MBC8537275.1 hypothetical protein [Feifania hominis]
MFEETNQTAEQALDLSEVFLPEDSAQSDAQQDGARTDTLQVQGEEMRQDDAGEQEPAKPAEPEDSPVSPEQQTYTVKYNGKEMALSVADLITNAQKGMNYDHVKAERDEARKYADIGRQVAQIAERRGLTQQAYLAQLTTADREAEIDRRAAELTKIGADPDLAKARARAELERAELTRETGATATSGGAADGVADDSRTDKEREGSSAHKESETRDETRKKELAEFVKLYPDVRKLPEEVVVSAAAGEPLISAYRAWENRELKTKLAEMEKQQQTRSKAIGSMEGAGETQSDPFLQGFDAVFR